MTNKFDFGPQLSEISGNSHTFWQTLSADERVQAPESGTSAPLPRLWNSAATHLLKFIFKFSSDSLASSISRGAYGPGSRTQVPTTILVSSLSAIVTLARNSSPSNRCYACTNGAGVDLFLLCPHVGCRKITVEKLRKTP